METRNTTYKIFRIEKRTLFLPPGITGEQLKRVREEKPEFFRKGRELGYVCDLLPVTHTRHDVKYLRNWTTFENIL